MMFLFRSLRFSFSDIEFSNFSFLNVKLLGGNLVCLVLVRCLCSGLFSYGLVGRGRGFMVEFFFRGFIIVS